jgi:hypothetical protein
MSREIEKWVGKSRNESESAEMSQKKCNKKWLAPPDCVNRFLFIRRVPW